VKSSCAEFFDAPVFLISNKCKANVVTCNREWYIFSMIQMDEGIITPAIKYVQYSALAS